MNHKMAIQNAAGLLDQHIIYPTVLVAILAIYVLYELKLKWRRLPPGPYGVPILGSLRFFINSRRNPSRLSSFVSRNTTFLLTQSNP